MLEFKWISNNTDFNCFYYSVWIVQKFSPDISKWREKFLNDWLQRSGTKNFKASLMMKRVKINYIFTSSLTGRISCPRAFITVFRILTVMLFNYCLKGLHLTVHMPTDCSFVSRSILIWMTIYDHLIHYLSLLPALYFLYS